MLQERDLIPYEVSPLPVGPWLLFAPHADDETFGLGGTLALSARAALEVTVVILTDGALGGNGDVEALCARRKNEARAAMARLGLSEPLFWDEPDRGLKVSERLVRRVAELIDECSPAHVFFPSPMEPHVDHRAAAELVWEGARRAASGDVRVAAYDITVQGPVNRFIDITSVVEEKREAIALYVSQLGENNYYEIARSLDVARTFSLGPDVAAAEGFYLFEREDLGRGYAEQVQRLLAPYWQGSRVAAAQGVQPPGPFAWLARRFR